MEIYNLTTNETETLAYYDRYQNLNQRQDSSADVTANDPGIRFNSSEGRYEADGSTIEYWRAWFSQSEVADGLELEVRQLLRESGEDDIAGRIREEIDQHYFEESSWPDLRIKLLTDLKARLLTLTEGGFSVSWTLEN